MAKFVIKQGRDKQWYFSLVSSNGEVVATSEGYSSKSAAHRGVEAVKTAAAHASVEEKEEKKEGKGHDGEGGD